MARDFVSTRRSIFARFYFLVLFFVSRPTHTVPFQFESLFLCRPPCPPIFLLKKKKRKGKLLFDGYVKNGREMES
jgi:hypothetical protein